MFKTKFNINPLNITEMKDSLMSKTTVLSIIVGLMAEVLLLKIIML